MRRILPKARNIDAWSILRCEDAPLLGLFAPHVYQDLVGIGDAEERRSRILAAAEGRSQALEPPPRPFIGVPPRIASFIGRTDELDRLDAILMRDKPAAVTQASVGRAAVPGMGGVGKTSLAIEYAHRFRGLYAGVCWCPAETRTGLLSALASLAVTLGAATTTVASALRCGSPTTRRRLQASSVRPRARASRRACHSRRRPSSRWVKTRQPSAPRSPMRPPCKRWPMRRQSSVASTSWSTTPRSTVRFVVAVSRRSARPNGTMRCARTSRAYGSAARQWCRRCARQGAAVSSTWPPLPRSTACRLRCTTRYRRRRWSD